jgi:hypothetical protein
MLEPNLGRIVVAGTFRGMAGAVPRLGNGLRRTNQSRVEVLEARHHLVLQQLQ